MKRPYFTVVIPLFNKECSVGRAVTSVLSQSFDSFELIIVDDGSTDCSIEVVSGFKDSRLKLMKQPNMGPSAARNSGFKAATAMWVCFLDADDKWDTGFLKTILSLIEMAPKASMYSVKYRVVDEAGHTFHHFSNYPDGYLGYVEDFFRAYAARGLINSSSVCIKRESLCAIGGFPVHARNGEDVYTWLRLADVNRVAYANVECVTIFRDAENRAGASVRQEIPYHIKAVLEGKAKEFTKVNRSSVIRFVVKNTVVHVAGAVLLGDRRAALEMARLLWGNSRRHSIQALCVAMMPGILLRVLKKLRNARRYGADFNV
jgi:glycosyltransferase involved in cell wall biosynthesis